MATSAASGIANAATRSAINGESFGKNLIAALPDIIGQAVGGTLAGGGQRLMEGGAQELADALSSGVIPAEDAERLSRLAKRLGVEKVFTALSAGGDGNDGKFSFVFTTDLQRAGAEKARADFRARGLGEDAATAAYYDVGRLIYLKEQVQGLSVGTQSSSFRRFERAFNLSLLAKDVYFSTSIPELRPTGYSVYSSGSVSNFFASSNNGYFARLYQGGNTIYLVNRGTNDTDWGPFGRTPDGIANASNLSGSLSDQHRLAADNADALVRHTRGTRLGVHFVGHSLGGSLASLQAVVTGQRATTFNATNLEVTAVEQYINTGKLKYKTIYGPHGTSRQELIISKEAKQVYGTSSSLIDYYYVDGDIARKQGYVGATQVGSPVRLNHVSFPMGLAKKDIHRGANLDTIRYYHHLPTPHSMNSIIYSLYSQVDAKVGGR
ncbi:MAG: hypothetical protein HEQ34_05665 [Sphingorhabdus sp.]|nr:hypothetical protein [Sphingorhabdus sp.]